MKPFIIVCILLVISYVQCNCQALTRNSIIIDELFPDPAPQVGLPNSEFLELKNCTGYAINLQNWRLSDGTSSAIISTAYILQPDSFVIICSNPAMSSFSRFGNSIGVNNFPSLNNEGDIISLYASNGSLIHAVGYTLEWYNNTIKQDGGWSIEMIDTGNPCSGRSNWRASNAAEGGSPGRKNSVDGINRDELPPALLRTYTLDSLSVVAVFNEPLDSLSTSVSANFHLGPAAGNIVQAIPLAPFFMQVKLVLGKSLQPAIVYNLSVKNITDCAGNYIGMLNNAKLALPVQPNRSDVVINEILFNPPGGGYDYVELYNRSSKTFDLTGIYVAGRNNTGALVDATAISNEPRLFFPGDYLVVTVNKNWLMQTYSVGDSQRIMEISRLPSLPDDKGTLLVIRQDTAQLDELIYQEQWHFPLLYNKEGVALERIDYSAPNQAMNWTSAASAIGFGTPGYQNSQFRADLRVNGNIGVSPKTFSPDNDGFDDFVSIHYKLQEPGYVVSVTIYDVGGKLIRTVTKNATVPASGSFRWDGLNENQRAVSSGIYVIVTDIFNLKGQVKRFKNSVILARRLN